VRSTPFRLVFVVALAFIASGSPAAAPQATTSPLVPAFQSIGPLTFSGNGILFAADVQAAAIYALDLGAALPAGAPGTKPVASVDGRIAALLGTDARDIAVTDLAVQPGTGNAFLSVMRGQGAGARPVLLRIDGAGKIDIVDFTRTPATKATLPNAPGVTAERSTQRVEGVTDMAYMDGRLYVAGLSNEEFASKLRSIAYPFATVDSGTSVEIYHGSHGRFETRSPVYTFVPYRIANAPHLIAGYLCTPLVKFPVSSLKPGEKILGTTIAELGAGNRPIDMILYKKTGREFLLMSNTRRGVMKIPTDQFSSAPAITARVADKGGIGYETVTTMTGIEQLDLLNETQSLVLARANGALNLDAVLLP
jgi:hypothetical protein